MQRTNGIIACGHEATAQAAIQMFEEGGNAFDAAAAALFCSFVSEPCMTSAGGGGFLLAHAPDADPVLYDFFCQTPTLKRPTEESDFYSVKVDYGVTSELFHIGKGSMAVPGTVAGFFSLVKDRCSLPTEVLIEPAIATAKAGVKIDWFQYFEATLLDPILAKLDPQKEIFYADGLLKKEGESYFFPEFIDFAEAIKKEGEDLFYQGEIGKKVAADCAAAGGHLTRADFEKYQVHKRTPLRFPFLGQEILTNPEPGLGGSLLRALLEELAHHQASWKSDQAKTWNQVAQSGFANHRNKKYGSTTQISVADDKGNAVSMTCSNGEGSGYMIPGTQISMNNMLGEAALLPNGFHSWDQNVRLGSMMTPSMVLDENGKVKVVTGTGGASRIPYQLAQMLQRYIGDGLNLHDAIQHPRVHMEYGLFNTEPDYPEVSNFEDFAKEVIRFEEKSMFFGGIHSVAITKDNFEGEGDPRRNGIVRATNFGS